MNVDKEIREVLKVRYYLVGTKDLKIIHIMHECAAFTLAPTILFVSYNILPFFVHILFKEDFEVGEWDVRILIGDRLRHDGGFVRNDWGLKVPYRTWTDVRRDNVFGAGLDSSCYCMDEALELAALWVPTCSIIWLGQLSLKALYLTQWTPGIRSIKVEVLAQQWSWIWVSRVGSTDCNVDLSNVVFLCMGIVTLYLVSACIVHPCRIYDSSNCSCRHL